MRQLTKRRTDGRAYQRPAAIRDVLHSLAQLDRAEVQTRLAVLNRRHPQYVPSECVVYLLREAADGPESSWFDFLYESLLTRCAINLRWAVQAGLFSDADGVREEILGDFALRIAESLHTAPERLDPFEVAFDLAFAAFRRDRLRKETKRGRRHPSFNPVPTNDPNDPDRWVLALRADDGSEDVGLYGAEYQVYRASVLAAIDDLPQAEREAVSLRLEGWPIHSEDDAVETIARRCGVDERTVRNRIKSGVGKLIALTQGEQQ